METLFDRTKALHYHLLKIPETELSAILMIGDTNKIFRVFYQYRDSPMNETDTRDGPIYDSLDSVDHRTIDFIVNFSGMSFHLQRIIRENISGISFDASGRTSGTKIR